MRHTGNYKISAELKTIMKPLVLAMFSASLKFMAKLKVSIYFSVQLKFCIFQCACYLPCMVAQHVSGKVHGYFEQTGSLYCILDELSC